jgi:membrane-associated phospholipid phosphatase
MTTTSNAPTPADRAARLLTEAFAPAHLVIGLLLLIGGASHPSPVRGLAWGALAALLVGALPYTWVLHAVRTERLTSRHIPDKRQRLRPLGIATAAALTGLVLLYTFEAPPQLVALVIAMLTGLTVTAAITHYWKISLHTAVAAGTATTLTIIYGAVVIVGWAVVSATGWSRIHLREHTPAQVLAGALVGAVVAAAVFLPLR